jgi:hypothetical protein
MQELEGFGASVRALLASLPAETAIAALSLLALAILLRASRRVPLNSAFSRRQRDEKERLEPEGEDAAAPFALLAPPLSRRRVETVRRA